MAAKNKHFSETATKIVAYCQVTGKGYTFPDLQNDYGCYMRGEYTYCTCHRKRLVSEYPFVIKKVNDGNI